MLQRRSTNNRYKIGLVVLILSFLLLLVRPSFVEASDTGWDGALTTIDQLHDSFSALELTNKQNKQQIQVLRKQNNEKLKEINIQVQLIDKVKLDKLKTEADKSQKKYAPLLAEYTDLSKKTTEARKRKDHKSVLLFELKRNRMKASVHAARQEIMLKKDALTAAQKQATAKSKIVKDILVPVQSIKKQITAENKKITDFNKQRIAADKRYKAAVKQGDAVEAASELRLIVGALSQIHASQNKIYEWETMIRSAIYAAEAKLPK
ncbi:coiled-coil domain-containing protein 22 [Paenibacillus selenitireducens]|uniref:coiled-coil domain-containing protein 22 n=1 Tax=Paenibacillus selenitireducens TaxID=1324314 RepID=UPI001E495A9B|nr:coiled-coil domain-containing protein 22 [Paenibacillus selenitireducens]